MMDSEHQKVIQQSLRQRFPKIDVCTSQCFSNQLRHLSESESNCLKECISPAAQPVRTK